MRYNEQIALKLYTYTNNTFTLQAIIDDYQEISFAHNLYEAGDFTITINYNIPNALKFERGMWIQFGNDSYMFGEIQSITDTIGEDGKGSQVRTITGKDARFIFKRRVIKNLNNEENWAMTAKGEICLRELVKAQCGSGVEEKRQLPITNVIPGSAFAKGKEYSVADAYSNLYDTLVTIATQSEIGWRIKFDGTLTLEVFEGSDLSSQVQFSTDFDSLSNGQFTDSAESYANTIYVGGKGTGSDRDIYEGESAIAGGSPAGLDRFEAWDNQSSMTSESEYEAEAFSMLTQYGQTLQIAGQGLAKCPYEFQKQYNIGDTITLAFSGKSAKAQILSVTEHWVFGQYGIDFSFGKPQNDFDRQMMLILKQIQKASNKTEATSSVKYYTIPTDTSQPKADVIYNTIGFEGDVGTGATFTLYYDSEKTGAKNYHVWFKQLAGSGKLTLTTGVSGASNLVLNAGTYVAIIYVDADGNVLSQGATATNTIQTGNTQPATSGGVAQAITDAVGKIILLNADANTVYPSENNSVKTYQGYFTNVPEDKPTSILTVARILRESQTYIEFYQEWEVYGVNTISSYAPNKYIRYGYMAGTGTGSITWSNWQKLIREIDLSTFVSNALALPKDAVLHYSFDELPNYPDGTAVLKQLSFSSTTGWSSLRCTLSIDGTGLKAQSNGNESYFQVINATLSANSLSGKIIKMKLHTNASCLIQLQDSGGSYTTRNIKSTKIRDFEYLVEDIIPTVSYNQYFAFTFATASADNYVVIDEIYIGDGSYATPVIDNANGQWNSISQSGVAVQGVSGKALKTYIAKYVDMGDYYLNDDFTVSIWVNPDNNSSGVTGEVLRRWGHFILRNGASWGNNLQVYVYFKDGTNQNFYVSNNLSPNVWTNLIVIKNSNKLYVYINGQKLQEYNLNGTELARNSTTNLTLSSVDNTRPQSYDDLLIFDRALSAQEIQALYLNKANTPKYFNLNNYELAKKLPPPPTADGNYTLKVNVASGVAAYSWT